MIYPQLHLSGQVWRPPYEANSQLLQLTSGCTWQMFARVTDITPKSVEELKNLHHLKLDSINIGIETAHNPTLERMNKGYHASDILEQLSKLDEAGIRYKVFYLNGLGGKRRRRGKRDSHGRRSQQAASLHHKYRFTDDFPRIRLYQEVLDGKYIEEPEIERLIEMRTLIGHLNIKVNLLGHHISNTVPVTGALPDDKTAILREFDTAIARFPEKELKAYRNSICHL